MLQIVVANDPSSVALLRRARGVRLQSPQRTPGRPRRGKGGQPLSGLRTGEIEERAGGTEEERRGAARVPATGTGTGKHERRGIVGIRDHRQLVERRSRERHDTGRWQELQSQPEGQGTLEAARNQAGGRARQTTAAAYTARLLVCCADRPGIVAAVSGFLFEQGANIVSSEQYSTDPTGGRFFLRTEFFLDRPARPERARAPARTRFAAEVAARFAMDWRDPLVGVNDGGSRSSSPATTTACSICSGAGAAASSTRSSSR